LAAFAFALAAMDPDAVALARAHFAGRDPDVVRLAVKAIKESMQAAKPDGQTTL
jgi:hypothetical protein